MFDVDPTFFQNYWRLTWPWLLGAGGLIVANSVGLWTFGFKLYKMISDLKIRVDKFNGSAGHIEDDVKEIKKDLKELLKKKPRKRVSK